MKYLLPLFLILIVSVSAGSHDDSDSRDLFSDLDSENDDENQEATSSRKEPDFDQQLLLDFVGSNVKDFKRIGKNSVLLIPYLKQLLLYTKQAGLKFLYKSLREMIRNYDIYIQDPSFHLENVIKFARNVIEYDNQSNTALFILNNLIDFIQERSDYVEEERFRLKLTYIKSYITHAKQAYQSISPVIFSIRQAIESISDESEQKIEKHMEKLKEKMDEINLFYRNHIISYKIKRLINDIQGSLKGKNKRVYNETIDVPEDMDDLSLEKLRLKSKKMRKREKQNNDNRDLNVNQNGKEFVSRNLDEFKLMANKNTIKPYLPFLKRFIKRADAKTVSDVVYEIIQVFDRYFVEKGVEKKQENFNSFLKSLQVYRNLEHPLNSKLTSSMEWIAVRVFYVDEPIKSELFSIKNDLETTKEYYNSISKILLPLNKKVKTEADMETSLVNQMMDRLKTTIKRMKTNEKTDYVLEKLTELENYTKDTGKESSINESVN